MHTGDMSINLVILIHKLLFLQNTDINYKHQFLQICHYLLGHTPRIILALKYMNIPMEEMYTVSPFKILIGIN